MDKPPSAARSSRPEPSARASPVPCFGRLSPLFLACLLVTVLSRLSGADEFTLAHAENLKKEIPEFEVITPQLFRGGQPSEKGLEYLKAFGIRTIVNFRHEREAVEWERKKVEALGLQYWSLPWRIQFHPRSSAMKDFLEITGKTEEEPVFFHCRRGVERTGVADALYRHFRQGLTPDEAFRRATEGHAVRFYWRPFMKARYREFLKELGPSAR